MALQMLVVAILATLATADTTTVNLNACSGTPQHFAQGLLYGISGSNTPPNSYYTDLAINYESAGGAQFNSQPAGYAGSLASYNYRFQTLVDAHTRIRGNNGVLIVKMADLYGADFTQSSSFVYPGDNGNWATYDAFVQQVISDLKSKGLAQAYTTQVEIWNEPDINFGGRPQSQCNAMFVRGTKAIRAAFPQSGSTFLPIVGPSTAGRPATNNSWWTTFLSYLKANGGTAVQPDVWNWHMEGSDSNDPIPPAQALPGLVQGYGLTSGIGLQNNEYGAKAQQVPGYSNWFRARYERLKFNALRGNWEGGSNLNSLMADYVKASGSSYVPTGEYQAAKFYVSMAGAPCTTVAGSSIDSYATASTNNATVLVGNNGSTGSTSVAFQSVSSRFGSATGLTARIYQMPYNSGAKVDSWTLSATQTIAVSGNTATVTFNRGNAQDGWAVQLTT